jgi:hypothetical protein
MRVHSLVVKITDIITTREGSPPQGLSDAWRGRKFFREFFSNKSTHSNEKKRDSRLKRILLIDRRTVEGGQGDAPLGLPPSLEKRGGHPHRHFNDHSLVSGSIGTFSGASPDDLTIPTIIDPTARIDIPMIA